ncbi:hypothetical protein BaRGS_00035172 [Batillaria attramentaria]|uniref:Pacifastin domain-containing protein n=1 Tax=Batillaria attramentaria TaxID=370345 RepID=A0ABD0JF79_9CAEN
MKGFILFTLLAASMVTGSVSAPTPVPEGCVYGGVEYPAGTSFQADCNTCHCAGQNLAMCTLRVRCVGQTQPTGSQTEGSSTRVLGGHRRAGGGKMADWADAACNKLTHDCHLWRVFE